MSKVQFPLPSSNNLPAADNMAGVTIMEYAIVLAAMGLLLYGAVSNIPSKTSQYYSDVTDGLEAIYPRPYWSS